MNPMATSYLSSFLTREIIWGVELAQKFDVQPSTDLNYLSVTAKFFVVLETINPIFLPWYKVLLRPLALHFSCRWLPISQWAKDMVALTGIGMV